VAGVQQRAGAQHDVAATTPLTRASHVRTSLRRLQHTDAVGAAVGVLDRHHAVRALDHDRPGEDARRLARPEPDLGGVARRRGGHDVELDRHLGDVRRAHGVAVHGRVVEGWLVDLCHHVVGERVAQRVAQRQVDDGVGVDQLEHGASSRVVLHGLDAVHRCDTTTRRRGLR
jgi:hypothetical protein